MTLDFSQYFPLKSGRAHEVVGPGSTAFAAIVCGQAGGPFLWLSEAWQSQSLNPAGLFPFCEPGQMLMGRADSQDEVLACAEEALRSGMVSVVVAELREALSFTAGRRLQLAAEMGKATGLLLIGEGMGNNAAESRWHCAPIYEPEDRVPVSSYARVSPFLASFRPSLDSTLQSWQLIKNKSGTLGSWTVGWHAQTHRVIVVSQAGERAAFAAASA